MREKPAPRPKTGVGVAQLIDSQEGFMGQDPDDRSFGQKIKDSLAGEPRGQERQDVQHDDTAAPDRDMREGEAPDDDREGLETSSDVTERTIHERTEHTSESG